MSRRVSLVVNPTAGRGRAQAWLPRVESRLRACGAEVETLRSTSYAHAADAMAAVLHQGTDVLAVMGGDGMVHLGLNACASPAGSAASVLALIPAGSGNDFCRGVGLDPADPMAAATIAATGTPRAFDLIRVDDRYVGAVLATGFDAQVNSRANALPWPKGSLRYPLAALTELRVFAPLPYRLRLDGVVREQEAMLVAVGNTAMYGGGMRICPDADPTDGLLDVTIIHPVSRVKLLQLLPQMNSGRFARDRCVERLQVRTLTVDGPRLTAFGDGERIGETPLDVSVAPRALPLLVAADR